MNHKYNKLIILGSNGMLGNYIKRYFEKNSKLQIICINRNDYDALNDSIDKLEQKIKDHLDIKTVVFNAIGVIPQAIKNHNLTNNHFIKINQEFPHQLANLCEKYQSQMIHSTTDCVYSGKKGNYIETDVHDETSIYGMTKSKGEPNNCTVIRTSIIGEEINNKRSLVEWIKSNNCNEIDGFTKQFWNGITCLQYAKILEKMINDNIFWKGVRHIFSPKTISKYELVCMINDNYKLNITINKYNVSDKIDKSINTIYQENALFNIPDLLQQIKEMRDFAPLLYDHIIPKVFYAYWDGSPLSYLQYLTVVTFKEYNPSWKIVLYMPLKRFTEKTWNTDEQKTSYTGTDYLPKLLEYVDSVRKIDFEKIGFKNEIPEVIKSDYLRYWLLSNYGGLWSDMDVIYLNSIEKMYDIQLTIYGDINKIDTVICYNPELYPKYDHYPIGFLLSSQNNPYYTEICHNAYKNLDISKYQSIGCELFKKLYRTPDLIPTKYPNLNILVINKYVYLPYGHKEIHNIFVNNVPENIKPYTVGIHWFNGSNVAVGFEHLLDQNKLPVTGSIYPYIKKYIENKV